MNVFERELNKFDMEVERLTPYGTLGLSSRKMRPEACELLSEIQCTVAFLDKRLVSSVEKLTALIDMVKLMAQFHGLGMLIPVNEYWTKLNEIQNWEEDYEYPGESFWLNKSTTQGLYL